MFRRLLAKLRTHAETTVAAPFEVGADDRLREVWTRDEWKQVQRGFDVLRMRGVQVFLRCDAPHCQPYVMTHHRDKSGNTIIRCPHKDRIFSRL